MAPQALSSTENAANAIIPRIDRATSFEILIFVDVAEDG